SGLRLRDIGARIGRRGVAGGERRRRIRLGRGGSGGLRRRRGGGGLRRRRRGSDRLRRQHRNWRLLHQDVIVVDGGRGLRVLVVFLFRRRRGLRLFRCRG